MESRTFSVYSAYLPHETPPHTATYHNSWPDQLQAAPESPPSSSPEDNVFLMQHLRFPTPPITPPRALAAATPPGRTQSVIMRVVRPDDYNYRPHHVPSCPEIETDQQQLLDHRPHIVPLCAEMDTDQQQLLDNATATASSRSESSSSPNCDHVCDWEECGRCFDSLDSLAAHVTKLHAVVSLVDGLYYCRWAGCQRTDRGFNARYKMLVHVRTHTKEKPHQCHLCQKSFSRAENLKIHIRSHSGERPYVCNFEGCSKKYSNSSDRFKHHRTHSMEKPYVCKVPGCMKRYTDPSSLRKHVKTFKHGVQLLESSSALLATARLASSGDQDQSQFYQSYIEMADSTDACHFGAPKSEYYDSEPYWLTASRCDSDIAPCQPRYSLHPDDDYNAMAMNLEMPLDLRVIRRS